MSLHKNCGWWKNSDYVFEFSVKSYVTNTINLSWSKILLPSAIDRMHYLPTNLLHIPSMLLPAVVVRNTTNVQTKLSPSQFAMLHACKRPINWFRGEVILEKPQFLRQFRNPPYCNKTRRFVTVFTWAQHLSLSSSRQTQSTVIRHI